MSVFDESLAPKLAKHTGQTVKELIPITLLNTKYISTFVTVTPDFLSVVFIVMVEPREDYAFPYVIDVTAQRVRVHLRHGNVLVWGCCVPQCTWGDLCKDQSLKHESNT